MVLTLAHQLLEGAQVVLEDILHALQLVETVGHAHQLDVSDVARAALLGVLSEVER